MSVRNIIKIDEDLCNGCGDCITDCEEGALAIVDGKAKLVKEIYCDGLGACLGACPTGALTIEEREADDFDEAAVETHLAALKTQEAPQGCSSDTPVSGGCPGSRARQFVTPPPVNTATEETPSQLTHWPVQLHLISPMAPYFQEADLLIAADCTAYAHGNFQQYLLAGRSLVIACPKLDNPSGYLEKLITLFAQANPKSVTVARMQVPCCSGLIQMVQQARDASGSSLTIREVVVGIEGEILSEVMC